MVSWSVDIRPCLGQFCNGLIRLLDGAMSHGGIAYILCHSALEVGRLSVVCLYVIIQRSFGNCAVIVACWQLLLSHFQGCSLYSKVLYLVFACVCTAQVVEILFSPQILSIDLVRRIRLSNCLYLVLSAPKHLSQ